MVAEIDCITKQNPRFADSGPRCRWEFQSYSPRLILMARLGQYTDRVPMVVCGKYRIEKHGSRLLPNPWRQEGRSQRRNQTRLPKIPQRAPHGPKPRRRLGRAASLVGRASTAAGLRRPYTCEFVSPEPLSVLSSFAIAIPHPMLIGEIVVRRGISAHRFMLHRIDDNTYEPDIGG